MSFNFANFEHKLAAIAADVVKGAKAVEHFIAAAASKGALAEPIVESLTALIDPAAVPLERAAFTALGLLAKAANDADAAAAGKGLVLTLDETVIADFKALYAVLVSRGGATASTGK